METFTPTIWLLLDDRAGNRSQCVGVGEVLANEYNWSFETKTLDYNYLSRLPNFILGRGLIGISVESRLQLNPPWPDLVIAAGRRLAPVARQIKYLSGGHTKIVQIMNPGLSERSEFDLIAVPAHDGIDLAENMIETIGSAHRITAERLEAEGKIWGEKFTNMPSPRLSLIVGGSTKNRDFTTKMATELGTQASELAAGVKGSLLISTSRRTSPEAVNALLAEIKVPSTVYKWGDEGDNPYFGYLSCCDAIIVTGDSMSMCSEACGTTCPVYIYAPDKLMTDKHQRLISILFESDYVMPLGDDFVEGKRDPINAAFPIARQVHGLFLKQ